MISKPLTPEDVKKSFVLAHELVDRVFKKSDISLKRLQDEHAKIKEELWNLSNSEIDQKMHKLRLRIYDGWYDSLDWTEETISFEEMGPYPGMQFININFTTGSIKETAERLKLAEKGKLRYDSTPEEIKGLERLLRKIKSINSLQGFLHDNVPAILVPGGMQRQTHYNDTIPSTKPKCKILKYDVDDGNSRMVSYAYQGLTKGLTLVGRAKDK